MGNDLTDTNHLGRYPNRKNLLTEQDYTGFTYWTLKTFYPKVCECGSTEYNVITSRPHMLRCRICFTQYSRYKETPLHRFRLPVWMFGYALFETLIQYPKVVPATELVKRLGIARNSATLLKRRIQLFAKDRMADIKAIVHKELEETVLLGLGRVAIF